MEITRKLEADVGHRLMRHGGKCRNAHGHRYVWEVTCRPRTGGGLDDVGRVIDFSVVKDLVGGWIDRQLDHAFVFEKGDPIGSYLVSTDQRCFEMAVPPSAENFASLVFGVAQDALDAHGIVVTRVRCHETPNCFADAYGRL